MKLKKINNQNYKKKFIVFGGGRWGLVHANELSKKHLNIKNI